MATAQDNPAAVHPARRLLPVALPAIVVGVGCALGLLVLSAAAEWVRSLLWEQLPEAAGFDPGSAAFIIVTLTLVGVATGLVVWLAPGHAGPDPATTGMAQPPQPLFVLPGLIVATVITLAGGVSLGPEFPIMAINTSLVVAVGAFALRRLPAPQWAAMSLSATIGALFGTPVAAALLLTETMAEGAEGPPLWDRLFAPLLAAGTGSVTMFLIAEPALALELPAYPGLQLIDVFSGTVIAAAAAVIGMAAVSVFPLAYALFHRLRHPLLVATVGGILLGLLGALGGPITLFKGVDEIQTLTEQRAGWTAAGLAGLAAVKLVALLIAGTTGFRGGRIFPAVFVGAALGLAANALVPDIPPALAVAAGILGMLMAFTRSGWLSLFTAAALVPNTTLLPVLTLLALPAWLICTGRPTMEVDGSAP
jgi:H+/Cl- antiporter ClcA